MDRLPTYAELESSVARDSLINFIKSNHESYKAGWFHHAVCEDLEWFLTEALAGNQPRLMIFAPPQHGKSEIVSRHFPAWAHGKYPKLRIVEASYASSLAEKNCKDVQRIMDGEFYQRTFKTRIAEPGSRLSVRTASEHEILELRNGESYSTTGSLRAVGVGGSLSGFPMDIGIIDDPFKDHEEAYSENQRDKVYNWWQTVFERRVSPLGGIIIMNTRWHSDDLCQRVLDTQGDRWRVRNYKGIATEDEEHRKKGEALTPERYPAQMLKQFEEENPVFFAALYQGTPITAGGNLFKSDMFDFCDAPEEYEYTFITADTAYKDKQENDFQVFSKWGFLNDELYLDEIIREKMKSSQVEQRVTPFIVDAAKWGFRGAWIEPKGHGIYLNQKLPEKGVMMPSDTDVKEFYKDRNRSKDERANLAIPFLGRRKIRINKRINCKEDLLAECLKFPKGKNDDFVDTVIDAVKIAYGRALSILDVL